MAKQGTIVALDVGTVRIGVAVASQHTRLAAPLATLSNQNNDVWSELLAIVDHEAADTIVIGLPRNLSGDDTAQTTFTRQFATELATRFPGTVVMQDEALTSQKAEAELKARGKSYRKEDVDSLAAVYILEDYMHEQGIV